MNMTQTIFQLQNINKIKVALLAALTLLTTSFSIHAEECAMNNSTIVVTAIGESQATPDMAIINLSIVTYDKTAQKALADNNKFMNNVMSSFKNNNIQEHDLQTSNLSIYQSSSDKQKEQKNHENLYEVSNSLTVRIRDLSNVGKIFDQAISLGINSVHGITFTNADTKPFYKEARKKAIAEAIEKAKTLAQAANLKLGKIIEINENNNSFHPTQRLNRSAQFANYADTNFSSGELNYNVSVTVTFSID
ncbi:outer membrane protein [Bartonella bovis 91-4]|uniref:Outer membrane protein n=2 Tax=Bartonella bovis TaxID=155194 RepID=N6VBN3_9HYPH|nr:outer membrane protein [Bartonella bovis 91-4]